jgi:hypothetical protein
MPNDSSQTRQLDYLDFEVAIGSGKGRDYPIAVVRSPGGEARETMRFPYDEAALEKRLKDLQTALLHSGAASSRSALPEAHTVQGFGQDLFDALLTGEARSCYDVSLSEAIRQGKGLRFKLRIQPPELAALPWEFLYNPRQAEYVCLSRNTPLVRYLELPQPTPPLTVTLPLRILGTIASPSDLVPLDTAREKQRVEKALNALRARGRVDLTWLVGQTWRDLQRAMRGGPWHIFHFVGHGGFDPNMGEGFVVLADERGRSHHLSAPSLSRLLADHSPLRLALLNSCQGARGDERNVFSSTAANLVRRGIPAVLATQYEITDEAAIEFSRTFYETLVGGTPVDAAVAEARKAVSLAVTNSVEWGAPVLYMRSSDGVLWEKGTDEMKEKTFRQETGQDSGTGDKIEGRVGAVGHGAQVAIGKQIRQVMTQAPTELTATERTEIDRLLAALKSQLASLDIPESKKLIGGEFVGQLGQELTRMQEPPDASTIKVAGDWLLKNVPPLAGAIASLFLNPIVGKVVEAAGDMAAEWVKNRFGGGA